MLASKQVLETGCRARGRRWSRKRSSGCACALGITSRYLRSTDAGEGLTPTELSILATISRRGSLRLTELAEIERVNPTMLSRIAGAPRRGAA